MSIILPGEGAEVATDTVSGEEVPLGKILIGGTGSGVMVSDTNPLPVAQDIETDTVSGGNYNLSKIAYGDDSSLTRVTQANPLPIMSLEELVGLGLTAGWSVMSAMGEREDMTVAAAGEDICRMNELSPASSDTDRLLTPSSSGEALSIYSESGSDSAVGAGVQEVSIDYIDSNYDQQTAVVATNGGTASTGITNAVFVNDVYATAVSSNGVAVGNIHVHKTGTASSIYNFIIAGGNKSLVPHRMVPDGHKLLVKGWHTEEAQGRRINFRLRSTDIKGVLNEGVFIFKDVAYCNKSQTGWVPINITIPARSIVKVTGWSDTGGAEGSCGWWGYLVAD